MPEQKKPFHIPWKLSPIILGSLLVGFIAALLKVETGLGAGSAISQIGASMAALVILPMLIGWIVWKCMRNPRHEPAMAVCVLMGVFALGSIKAAVDRSQEHVALLDMQNQIETANAELTQLMEKEIDEGDVHTDRRLELANQMVDKLDEVKKELSGRERVAVEVTRDWLSQMTQQSQWVAQAINALGLEEPGGVWDYASFTSVQDIDPWIERVTEVIDLNEGLLRTLRGTKGDWFNQLVTKGFSNRDADAAVRVFEERADLDLAIQIREQETRVFTCLSQSLTLLKENWGQWSYDARKDQLLFESDTILENYNGLMVELEEAASDQEDLQRRLLQARAERASRSAKR